MLGSSAPPEPTRSRTGRWRRRYARSRAWPRRRRRRAVPSPARSPLRTHNASDHQQDSRVIMPNHNLTGLSSLFVASRVMTKNIRARSGLKRYLGKMSHRSPRRRRPPAASAPPPSRTASGTAPSPSRPASCRRHRSRSRRRSCEGRGGSDRRASLRRTRKASQSERKTTDDRRKTKDDRCQDSQSDPKRVESRDDCRHASEG